MIETDRLVLRSWRDSDRGPFVALCQSPTVMEFLGGPLTEEQVDAGISRIRATEREQGFCFWAVERVADNAFIGFCGLKVTDVDVPVIRGEIEIGWRIREDCWGHGYAREAALATLAWGWANLDASRIIAMTVPPNWRSWGLMERLGMSRAPSLDFGHPAFPGNHPLHRHIVYSAVAPR